METWNERLVRALKAKGRTQTELAKAVGIKQPSVNDWTAGKTKKLGAADAFNVCQFLGIRLEWLVHGNGPMAAGAEGVAEKAPSSYRPDSNAELAEYEGFIEWDDDTPPIPGSVAVPFFTGVDLSAGNGSDAGEEAHGAKLMFARSTLSRQGVDVNNAVCVKVRGSSMEPALFDGSVVGVDTSATAILEGKMYAIRHYDDLRVKFLYPRPDGGLRIVSVNRPEYPDEILTPDEAKHVTVIGRVFWSSTLY